MKVGHLKNISIIFIKQGIENNTKIILSIFQTIRLNWQKSEGYS
jgi:hypothetical protein